MTSHFRSFSACMLAIGFLRIFLSTPALAQPPEQKCDWTSFEHHAAEMRAARAAAMKIVVEDSETDVSPETIKQIQAFKNGLFAAYQDFFLCQPPNQPAAGDLETNLYTKLGLPEPKPESENSQPNSGPYTGLYLTDVDIKVETVQDSRKLIAIRTRFEIPYGNDAELDIFGLADSKPWDVKLHYTSQPYATILGAYTAFDYRISPADKKGDWFVVTTHKNPWPTSCWQGFYLDVLRPGWQEAWAILDQRNLSFYMCTDETSYIKAISTDRFQVVFPGSSIDEGALIRDQVYSYHVRNDEVTRIAPVALNSVNFVDEWVSRDWQQAQDWSAIGNREEQHRIHSKIHSKLFGDFESLRSCSLHGIEQITLSTIDEGGKEGPSWYFSVHKEGDNYTMVHVGNHPDPSCKGRNRLSSIQEK